MCDYVLGIDIAKATFDVALLPMAPAASSARERPRTRQFANTPAGRAALCAWLPVAPARLQACLEATSTYGLALAETLRTAGCVVSVVNPYPVKHFAHAELQRSKTDRIDAGVLARFCRSQRPAAWTPPTPTQRQLQGLIRRLDDVQQLRQQEMNRLQVPGLLPAVHASLQRVLDALAAEQAALEAALTALVAADPALAAQVALVTTIPGIGVRTALAVLAELGDVTRFRSAREVAAYAGLVPAQRTSGTSVRGKPHLSKCGAGSLRRRLYLPALTARRWNPRLRAWADTLAARGKAPMAIIGAVMHKLLRIIFGVLRSQTPYQEQVAT